MRISTASIVMIAALAWPMAAWAKEARCFASWSQAAEVVRKEQLVKVEQLSRQSHARLGGSIVKTGLCKIGERYVYRLVVRMPRGLRFVTLDARDPFDK